MMLVNYNPLVCVDMDGTIALWVEPTVPGPGKVEIEYGNTKIYLTPHNYHIQILHQYIKDGFTLIAWSSNGATHCETVVKALGLEHLFMLATGKPAKVIDDNPNPAAILGPRVFEEDLLKSNMVFVPAGYRPTSTPGIFTEK